MSNPTRRQANHVRVPRLQKPVSEYTKYSNTSLPSIIAIYNLILEERS